MPAEIPLALANLLVAGAALAALAAWLIRNPARLAAWLAAAGGPPPSAGERRALPGVLGAAGAGWIAAWALLAYPYPHGAKPFWCVAATVALLPAAPLLLLGLAAWVLLLRRRR